MMQSRFYGSVDEDGPRLLGRERTALTLQLAYGAELPTGALCDAEGRPDPTGEKVTFTAFCALVRRHREQTLATS